MTSTLFNEAAETALNNLYNCNDFRAEGNAFRSQYLGVLVQLHDRDTYYDHVREQYTKDGNIPPTKALAGKFYNQERKTKIERRTYAVIEI